MAQKKVKTRIQNKHDLEVNWLAATNFIPLAGELIFYDSEIDENGSIKTVNDEWALPGNRSYPITGIRCKIGDGLTPVNSLPFVGEKALIKQPTADPDPEGYVYLSVVTTPEIYNGSSDFYLEDAHADVLVELYDIDRLRVGSEVSIYCPIDRSFDNKIDYTLQLYCGPDIWSDVRLFVKPDNCIRDGWTLSNTINDSSPNYTLDKTDRYDITMSIHLPADVDPTDGVTPSILYGLSKVKIKRISDTSFLIEPEFYLE